MTKKIIGITTTTPLNPSKFVADVVPEWAKQPEKPTYTAEEVGAATPKYVDDLFAKVAENSGGNSVFVQDEEPADVKNGDIWIDTDEEGEKLVTEDQMHNYVNNLLEQQSDSLVFVQPDEPIDAEDGALWLDTDEPGEALVTEEQMYSHTDRLFKQALEHDAAVYTQPDEPIDAKDGAIWIDTGAEEEKFVTEEQLKSYVDGAIQNNTPVLEETDPTVPEWAKQPTKPSYTAKEISCDTEINGEQKTNVADALDALAAGGDNWELIVEHNEPLTNAEKVYITEDSEGNSLKLKEAILFVAITTKGSSSSFQGVINNVGYTGNIGNSNMSNRSVRYHFKKDVVDGVWTCHCYVGNLNSNYLASNTAYSYSFCKYSSVVDEYINTIMFTGGAGAEYAGYKLYGVRG